MKGKTFQLRVINTAIEMGAVSTQQPRILRAVKRIRAIENTLYTENDLRGLPQVQKEIIRNNDYKCYTDIRGKRYYMFIGKDCSTGKKKLYAYEKSQMLNMNGHDISNGNLYVHNYECWLTIDSVGYISKYNYEVRFCANNLAPIWVYK